MCIYVDMYICIYIDMYIYIHRYVEQKHLSSYLQQSACPGFDAILGILRFGLSVAANASGSQALHAGSHLSGLPVMGRPFFLGSSGTFIVFP